jgi:hypothetical protein
MQRSAFTQRPGQQTAQAQSAAMQLNSTALPPAAQNGSPINQMHATANGNGVAGSSMPSVSLDPTMHAQQLQLSLRQQQMFHAQMSQNEQMRLNAEQQRLDLLLQQNQQMQWMQLQQHQQHLRNSGFLLPPHPTLFPGAAAFHAVHQHGLYSAQMPTALHFQAQPASMSPTLPSSQAAAPTPLYFPGTVPLGGLMPMQPMTAMQAIPPSFGLPLQYMTASASMGSPARPPMQQSAYMIPLMTMPPAAYGQMQPVVQQPVNPPQLLQKTPDQAPLPSHPNGIHASAPVLTAPPPLLPATLPLRSTPSLAPTPASTPQLMPPMPLPATAPATLN